MKILYIHTKYFYSAGGEDAAVQAEIELMRSKGHVAELMLFDNSIVDQGMIGKIKTGVNLLYNANSARRVREKIQIFQPDVVHVHNFFFAASPSVLIETKKLNVPVAVTIHNFRLICANALLLRNGKVCELCISHDFPWYGVRYKCYHKSAIQSAMVGGMSAFHKKIGTWKHKVDTFITTGEFARSKLLNSSFNASAEKIKVKRNFIPDPGVATIVNREPFYLFVGRISEEKGVRVLLDAWEQFSNEKLLIVGDGPETEGLVAKYGSQPNVTFLGKKSKDDVISLMKRCKALIFPSIWYEGLPLTIVESFATGTPIIASNLGAMQEMVQHNENGLLFEHSNPAALVAAVSLFNEYLLKGDVSMYLNARKSYEEYYHPDKCYDAIMEIYLDIIRENKKSNAER